MVQMFREFSTWERQVKADVIVKNIWDLITENQAEQTIDILGLNSNNLVEGRKEAIQLIQKEVNNIAQQVHNKPLIIKYLEKLIKQIRPVKVPLGTKLIPFCFVQAEYLDRQYLKK